MTDGFYFGLICKHLTIPTLIGGATIVDHQWLPTFETSSVTQLQQSTQFCLVVRVIDFDTLVMGGSHEMSRSTLLILPRIDLFDVAE